MIVRPAFVAALLALSAVGGSTPLAAGVSGGIEAPGSTAHRYFTDVVLVDQNGREVRLYSDLLQGKVVVIDSMFTECTSACPLISSTMQKIQDHLGDRLGKEVHLLSFSVDPAHDTPARLKEYAARYHARPGWYFLTGKKENLELALKKLGLYVENREGHVTLITIGNDRTGLWKKALGLAQPQDVLPIVDSVLKDTGDGKVR
jgi:protein SCO1/2